MKGKKIYFLISSLGSGGAERTVCSISSGLAAKRYEVCIVTLNHVEKPTYPVDERVRIISLVSEKRGGGLFARLRAITKTFLKLFGVLRSEAPAIVLAFQSTANLWAGIMCSLLNIPYVVSERTSPDRSINKKPPYLQKLMAVFYRNANAVVAPSNGILRCLSNNKYFSSLNNTMLIQNAVQSSMEPQTGQVHHRKFVLAAGRLAAVKGFDLLIDSFSMVGRPDVDLLIVGRGTEHGALSDRISVLGLENRIFLRGEVENIQDYYRQCEVFVLPSRNEGYPNVLIEAMSMGAPCVSFDCEFGPAEIIRHEENGLLVRNGDTRSLAEAVSKVLAHDDLREKFSEAGKEVLTVNSFNAILGQWESLIKKYA